MEDPAFFTPPLNGVEPVGSGRVFAHWLDDFPGKETLPPMQGPYFLSGYFQNFEKVGILNVKN
jgi:hypothetical protein